MRRIDRRFQRTNIPVLRGLLSAAYGWIISRRNARFDRGIGVSTVDVPVISVGNLSMGGSGKSPLVIRILELLIAMGKRPAVVSRGYGRRSSGVVVVSDGSAIQCQIDDSGDELMMIARRLPSVVVIASNLRHHGAARAVREYQVDCIVLDDAFQHRQLHRDLDIVIVNQETLGNPKVMPAGVLRESISGIRRADLVCCAESVSCLDVQQLYTGPCVELQTVVREFVDATTTHLTPAPDSVLAFCGIAHPKRFVSTVMKHGVECVGTRYFRDHHRYTSEDIASLIDEARAINVDTLLCTEKDAVKLESYYPMLTEHSLRLVVIRIETRVGNEHVLHDLLRNAFENQKGER